MKYLVHFALTLLNKHRCVKQVSRVPLLHCAFWRNKIILSLVQNLFQLHRAKRMQVFHLQWSWDFLRIAQKTQKNSFWQRQTRNPRKNPGKFGLITNHHSQFSLMFTFCLNLKVMLGLVYLREGSGSVGPHMNLLPIDCLLIDRLLSTLDWPGSSSWPIVTIHPSFTSCPH